MSEYNNFNIFTNQESDETEMDRIQKEISKDLSVDGDAAASIETIYKTESDVSFAHPASEADFGGALDNTDVSVFEAEVLNAPVPDLPPKKDFYMETVKKKKNGTRPFLRTVVAACIIAVIGGPLAGLAIGVGTELGAKYFGTRPPAEELTAFSFDPGEVTTISVAPNASSIIDDFSGIVDLVEPSVVGITSVSVTERQESFFPTTRESVPSKGSGIIFDEDNENVYIVTNYHVVNGASKVGVSVEGNEPVSASLVGQEQASDLAVISIKKSDLKAIGINSVKIAIFGDSDNMKVGEIVMAIGNALGEGNTATLGIVSAKSKDVIVEGLSLTVMQTDAAINPGNSGGPLINVKGEVIAINTAKFQYYDVEGTGYSIPVNEAKPIIERLRNRIPKAFVGVHMTNMNDETAELFNLPTAGVLVVAVAEGSPAEKAGILRNDVITGFDGAPVLTIEDITGYIAERAVGDTVEIKLYRHGEGALALKVTLAEMPPETSF